MKIKTILFLIILAFSLVNIYANNDNESLIFDPKPRQILYKNEATKTTSNIDYSTTAGFENLLNTAKRRSGFMNERSTKISHPTSSNKNRWTTIIGKLNVANSTNMLGVVCACPLLNNGVFATAIYASGERELQIFKSGYEPLSIWLDPNKLDEYGEIIDVGEIYLKKSSKTSKVTISLDLPKDIDYAEVLLRIASPGPIYSDWGYTPHRNYSYTVAKGRVYANKEIVIRNLSAIPYKLEIKGPKLITWTKEFMGTSDAKFSKVKLHKSPKYTIMTRSSNEKKWDKKEVNIGYLYLFKTGGKDIMGCTDHLKFFLDKNGNYSVLSLVIFNRVLYDYGMYDPTNTNPNLPEPKITEKTFKTDVKCGYLYRVTTQHNNTDIQFIIMQED